MPLSTPTDIIIRNGTCVDPSSSLHELADVIISQGVIHAIGQQLDAPQGCLEIDATDCLLAPGLIDPHVHLREPGYETAEDIASGTSAAAAGGFTTVCCMPNTNPCLDSPEVVADLMDRIDRTAHVRVFPVCATTFGRQGITLTDIPAIHKMGAVAFSDDGDYIEDTNVMREVMRAVKALDMVFMQHCQVRAMTGGSTMHEGSVSRKLGQIGWPREAEELAIERDIALVRETGCRYHVQHLSSSGSVELIRKAKAEGLPVSAEASPHHLLLTHHAIETNGIDGSPGYWTAAKMNPPLREAHDLEAVRAGVADGTIDILATDHAPHPTDAKSKPFAIAPFGIIGLETALPLYAEALVETGLLDWPALIRLMTQTPAALCGLDAIGLGALRVGGPADITVIDPKRQWTISLDDLKGKSCNSPFIGRHVTGRATHTICKGQLAHQLAPQTVMR